MSKEKVTLSATQQLLEEMNNEEKTINKWESVDKISDAITIDEKVTIVEKEPLGFETREIDLSGLNLKSKIKDLKTQKSIALKQSTIVRLIKLSEIFNTSVSDIADKAIRIALKLENK